MSSKRKTSPWQAYFTPQQQDIVKIVIAGRTGRSFLFGTLFGFILCTGTSYFVAEKVREYGESKIVNNAVEDRLQKMSEELYSGMKTSGLVPKTAEEWNEEFRESK